MIYYTFIKVSEHYIYLLAFIANSCSESLHEKENNLSAFGVRDIKIKGARRVFGSSYIFYTTSNIEYGMNMVWYPNTRLKPLIKNVLPRFRDRGWGQGFNSVFFIILHGNCLFKEKEQRQYKTKYKYDITFILQVTHAFVANENLYSAVLEECFTILLTDCRCTETAA